MKKIVYIMILMLSYSLIHGKDKLIWENCSDGLEGAQWMNLINFDNIIYETNLNLYSKDTTKTWIPNKHDITTELGNTYLIYHAFYDILKYKNRYLSFGPTNYYSFDKITWNKLDKFNGIPDNSNKIKYYSTDSTFLIQVYNKQYPQNKYRMYITKDSINYSFVPVENDIHYLDSIIEFIKINDVIYATTNSQLSTGVYYLSKDGGMNWEVYKISNVSERIKYIRYFNDRFYLLTSFGVWYKDNLGNWNRCISEEYLNDMGRDFLISYKNRIITHSKINDKSVLVSSSDGGITWERFGNSNFYIRQLLVVGNTLIANTNFGIKISNDDGLSWEEKNNGIFTYSSRSNNPKLQIIANGNEALTAPRNTMINNIIMKSYDNGNKWIKKQIDPNFEEPEQMRVTTDWYSVVQTKWGIFAINGLGYVYKTEDFGETWKQYSTTSGGVFLNPKNLYERNDTIFCYYSYKIYFSTNKGVTFIQSDIEYRNNLPDSSWHWTIIEGVHYSLNKNYMLYKSQNDGINWEYVAKFDFQGTANFSKINFIDSNNIYFTPKTDIEKNTPLFVSEDFGKNWNEVNLPLYKTPPTTWLKHNRSIYVLYIENYKTTIYASSDNCQTWEIASDGLGNKEIIDMFSAGNFLYVSTKEGLYKANTGTVDVLIENETLYPIEIYPNPVKEIAYFKNNYYKLIKINVFDLTGFEHKVNNFSNQYFEIPLLPRGIYIIKLYFEGNWSITKKIIKL